jgi:serine/threonine-protein kinase
MKPANCFVTTRDGEPDFLKVIDFGISKMAKPEGARLTRTHAMLGTPLYMAPEQVRSARRVDHRTDLYGAALILYELLSGRTPFLAEENGIAGLFAEVLLGDPTPLGSLRPDLPSGLVEAVHKALSREPADRFENAFEMAEALGPFADERSHPVMRGIRRRAGRGTDSSLRPPPGAEVPGIPAAPKVPAIDESAPGATVAEEPLCTAGSTNLPNLCASAAPAPSSPDVGATPAPLEPAPAGTAGSAAKILDQTAMGDSAAAVAQTAADGLAARRSRLGWAIAAAVVAAGAATLVALSTTRPEQGVEEPLTAQGAPDAPAASDGSASATALALRPAATVEYDAGAPLPTVRPAERNTAGATRGPPTASHPATPPGATTAATTPSPTAEATAVAAPEATSKPLGGIDIQR